MSKEKICPIMSGSETVVINRGDGEVYNDYQENDRECIKERCNLWVQVYSSENIPFYTCAFDAMAHKNAEGRYQV